MKYWRISFSPAGAEFCRWTFTNLVKCSFFQSRLFVDHPSKSDRIQLIHSVVIRLILLAASNVVKNDNRWRISWCRNETRRIVKSKNGFNWNVPWVQRILFLIFFYPLQLTSLRITSSWCLTEAPSCEKEYSNQSERPMWTTNFFETF